MDLLNRTLYVSTILPLSALYELSLELTHILNVVYVVLGAFFTIVSVLTLEPKSFKAVFGSGFMRCKKVNRTVRSLQSHTYGRSVNEPL